MPARTSRFAVILMLVAACATNETAATPDTAAPAAAPTADAGTVRQAIDSASARYADAVMRGDATAAVAHFADDAIFMAPNREASRGREAIREWHAGGFSAGSFKEFKTTTEDVLVGGDLAVETGTYEFRLQPRTGGETADKGKYVVVWKRRPDGSWKVVRDVFNSDRPAKP